MYKKFSGLLLTFIIATSTIFGMETSVTTTVKMEVGNRTSFTLKIVVGNSETRATFGDGTTVTVQGGAMVENTQGQRI